MKEFLVPSRPAQAEFVEKKSTFIGYVWPAVSEAEAVERIEETRRKHYDARHNCWCWLLHEGGQLRYSDDGEPQGTAGQPMLNVFQRERVENVVCVVTRYFGGVLLGAGGLVRAYTAAAKLALDAAGISAMRPWSRFGLDCPYSLFERVKLETLERAGQVEESQFGAQIRLILAVPAQQADGLTRALTELFSGRIKLDALPMEYRPVPL